MKSSPPPDTVQRRSTARALLALSAGCAIAIGFRPQAAAQAQSPKLLLAFSSYRDNLGYPQIYFYRHDGVAAGSPAGGIPPGQTRSDHRPALAASGRLCAWTQEVVGKVSQIGLWDLEAKASVPLPNLAAAVADLGPSLSSEGDLLAFSSWRRPGGGGWDLLLYDRKTSAVSTPKGLNSEEDDRMPALSGNVRFVAFASARASGAGLSDIYLYDREAQALVPLPGLNSRSSETEPTLSGDGRYLAFISDRSGGAGQRDVYLYDRQAAQLLPLPGLNSLAPEQAPALTSDGRYLAFVSERLDGAGHRDVYLYDRSSQKLLPTPNLNSPRDDVDAAIILQ